jgi:hypothetical protein
MARMNSTTLMLAYNGTMNDLYVVYIHGLPNCIVLHAKWPYLVERFNKDAKPPLHPTHDFQLFLTLLDIDRTWRFLTCS